MAKVLIVVQGGVVQGVVTDSGDVDIYLREFDNNPDGEIVEFPVEINPSAIQTLIKETD